MLDKGLRNTHWLNDRYCNNSSCENDIHKERMNLIPYLSIWTNISSKTDLGPECQTAKLKMSGVEHRKNIKIEV